MAAINDLIARIQDPDLRQRIDKEVKELTKQKKFGLVFENHVPEMTLLYDYPISRGCKVIRKSDDNKKLSEDILWEVKKVSKGIAFCIHTITNEAQQININDLICVAKNGEPIYPCLKFMDSVQNAPDSDLWHTLIEADNYHALQLLAYLYPGMVDCIYIDPPYNKPDSHDWKYNCDYVDGNDSYRHSKWLYMMESRLKIAKKLLNPEDSVLIVTIDELEYHHLGCLLEQMFPEAKIQMVSSVINPKGNRRDNEFSRCEEFIYFIYFGAAKVYSGNEDMLRNTEYSSKNKSIRLRALLRGASNHGRRTDRPNLFYPLLFKKDTGHFVGHGEVLDINETRENYIAPIDCVAMWPIALNGEELTWNLQPSTLMSKYEQKFLSFGKFDGKGRVGYYLSSGQERNFKKGLYQIIGTDEDGAYILELKDERNNEIRPLSIWNKKSHSASEYGTTLINKIIGSGKFGFPKSLYAVHDTIRFFVANKPNALILDFFAGSGTTLHAVNLLNKEDGGHRRCIMVTNNEIGEPKEKELLPQSIHPGDDEWEKWGIARYVNWPRTKCSILGVDVNGKPIEGDYITSLTETKLTERKFTQINFLTAEATKKQKKALVTLINKQKDVKLPTMNEDVVFLLSEEDKYNATILFDTAEADVWMEELDGNSHITNIYIVAEKDAIYRKIKADVSEMMGQIEETVPVKMPMKDGFEANAAFYKLSFLDKEAVSIGTQLNKLLSILWMKAGAHGICPTHAEGDYAVYPDNRMAILIDEYGFGDLKEELANNPQIETVYIIEDSEENYRSLASQLTVKNTYQLYRDYLDNFKINIERK